MPGALLSLRPGNTQACTKDSPWKMNSRLPEGRDSEGLWDGHVHAAMFKMDNQQKHIVKHRELHSTLCGSLDGRGVWGGWMHVYVGLSPFAIHLKP